MSLQKPSADGVHSAGKTTLSEVEWIAQFPTLGEYLTEWRWADGTERQTATLLVFAEDGLWKLCLRDRACGRSCWVSGYTLDDAVRRLEERLCSDSVEWRADRPKGGRR